MTPDPRKLDRYEAPNYLARYRQRQGSGPAPAPVEEPDSTPLYLRRFRERGAARAAPPPPVVEHEGATFTPALAEATRGKEIAAPVERRASERFVREISIIRHGITQGYSTDAGLTPMGGWQAHRRGHELSRRWDDGDRVRLVCADTNRARQTADQLYRGGCDGMAMWGKHIELTTPVAIPELRNFGVWTPDGLRDVTSAFRQYQSTMEKLERMAVGDRPRWLVEIDRFYRVQLGGADPIQMWLTIPMMYFEPPALCVRRFWRGFHRLIVDYPDDTRILAATHSGPMRAFATWAHGYDPGEPLNTEEIRVKVREGAQTAFVSYRNRVTEVNVPPPDEFPGLGIMTITDLDEAILDPVALAPDVPELVPDESDGQLRSVSIAMGVLGCFETEAELGATRVARELGVAKSTACRMLAALAASGMLERTGSGRYRLGLRLFEIGQLAVDRLMLRELALPVLGELRDVLRETAQLAVPVGADVLYVERLETTGVGTIFRTELYRRGPGHSSSAGKAMAAFNPTMERAILDRGFVRRTPFTIVDPARYRQVLRQIRTDGVAASREEHTMGLSSVAAPIMVQRGEERLAVAAISVVGATSRLLGPRKIAVAQTVRRAASRVSLALARS